MDAYQSNRAIHRGRARGLMGPAVLITLGVLLLLSQLHAPGLSFGRTWPILLIVIGLVRVLAGAPGAENDLPARPAPPAPFPPAPPQPDSAPDSRQVDHV